MKVGDLVKVREDERFADSGLIGLVQWVDTEYPPRCCLLIEDNMAIYDPRVVEVVA
ncbi:MAG: hypothetical protein VYD37_07100 [Gemmatimonadota bacterium]|nr:hypothetical protein [Gemmatimonadota bacterium]